MVGDLCPPLSPFAAPSPSQECLARGAPGHNSTARRPTPAIDDLSFSHTPSGITLAVDPGLTGSTVQASPSLPQQGRIYILILKKGAGGAGGSPSVFTVPPCGRACG